MCPFDKWICPYVKSLGNNDVFEITGNQSDSWLLMPESFINIMGQIDKATGDVSLT